MRIPCTCSTNCCTGSQSPAVPELSGTESVKIKGRLNNTRSANTQDQPQFPGLWSEHWPATAHRLTRHGMTAVKPGRRACVPVQLKVSPPQVRVALVLLKTQSGLMEPRKCLTT